MATAPDQLTLDQRDEYEERAAIMQYLGGLSREAAEREAMVRVMRKVKR